jgi:hypothetical protein
MILIGDISHGRVIAMAAKTNFDVETMPVISRVAADGSLLGGVIYSDYTGRSIRMHMAGMPGWASIEMCWIAFDYPFNQLNVEQVLGTVASTDEKVLEYDHRLGFREIARIPRAVPDGDLVILSMLRDECRWLKYRSRYIRTNGRLCGEHVHA